MGPNMMWNTKYGMMGDWMMGRSVWNQDYQLPRQSWDQRCLPQPAEVRA
jgi:hypothetical protein